MISRFLVLALVLLFATTANARSIKDMAETIQHPLELKAEKSHLLSVEFNHAAHRGYTCFTCHHKVHDTKGRYAPCSTCHTPKGRSQDSMSLYNAFHAKKSNHSCYSCHNDNRTKSPAYAQLFANCRPCHTPNKATKQPITIKASSPLLNVTFTHASHGKAPCALCHHKNTTTNGRYVACRVCHVEKGRTTAKDSLFAAAHSKKANRSCYACHTNLATNSKTYAQKFYNCRPCHSEATTK